MNLTLRSNPILANLLKTNNETNFDPSIITMESLLMSALAANMDYLRNYSIGKDRDVDINQDDSNHDRTDSNAGDSNRLSGDDSKELPRSDLYRDGTNHLRRSISDDKRVLSYSQCLKNSRNDQYTEAKYTKSDLNHKNDVSSVSGEQILDRSKSDDQNVRISELNRQKSDENFHNSDPIGLSYAMNFSTKLSDRAESLKYNGNCYRERLFSTEFEDSEKSIENVRSRCDTDLNESMDSNSLVIDENA